MTKGWVRLSRDVSVVVSLFAMGTGCASSKRTDATDGTGGSAGMPEAGMNAGGGMDAAAGASGRNMTACRVPLDDALNPCEPTIAAHSERWRDSDFGYPRLCQSTITSFTLFEESRTWQCIYGPGGSLIAWNRIENGQKFCDGVASAAVGDSSSRNLLFGCLEVDEERWTWIQSFDPGPPTISITLTTLATASAATISAGLGFILGGSEISESDLSLRYWYTSDASGGVAPVQSASCDGTNGVSCDYLDLTIVPVTPPRPMADTYAQIAFRGPGIISTGFDFGISFSVSKADGSLYDQSNDYSYNGGGQGALSTKVTAYLGGSLIYGVEP